MAQTKKGSAGRSSSSAGRKSSGRGNTQGKTANSRNTKSEPMDVAIRNEIILIALFAAAIFLFLCNFGIAGVMGNTISNIMFGIFGLTAYVMPLALFFMIAFGMVNSGNAIATRKLVAGVVVFLLVGMMCELFAGGLETAESYQVKEIYVRCSEKHNGGGILAGSFAYLCYHFMGMIGTILIILVAAIISVVVLTDKSFVSGVKSGGRKVYERSKEDAAYRRERAMARRKEQEEERKLREEEKRLRAEERENEKILRMDKKVSGVMIDTSLTQREEEKHKTRDDIHEINLTDFEEQMEYAENKSEQTREEEFDFDKIRINSAYIEEEEGHDELSEITDLYAGEEEESNDVPVYDVDESQTNAAETYYEEPVRVHERVRPVAAAAEEHKQVMPKDAPETQTNMQIPKERIPKKYIFPPISKLAKGMGKAGGDSARELKETAMRLQQTLQTFGVRVSITDISQGPSVTRFELQPEQGVKVSKIVGLTDDIKLNLAATDIRIEAPIPGKAAVGIEVPNKENMTVALRDLLESKEFKEFPSNLAFAVGKDIGGKVVMADIAKMPHMLIAGATGSGKSVCINTLIMSILYKAHPDDVKLIMVDPKVVELSVYNGIPHLLIPVVTDPKKASAALQWGVAEMTDRYQKFADFNVRDLKGYNKKVEAMREKGDSDAPAKLPQIVIIVDELADLMMVCPGEVEESICRLAQLARAAGIHLIIATQRPSVDVITGLIKANMPSRVAFSVSSGVDSRTILDMNGAEKLLGKGDMLFYPQGYSKPARVQGAFVSDKEVSDVVEFLKNQTLGNIYDTDIQEKISTYGSGSAGGAGGADGAERDQYFVDAAKFIIEKDKASIGMLQRVFKIGFNRAARIMDQLCEAGVVGEEEGTKPRKVLMSEEQFEQYIEECL
ncbi:MAG: DNA translocase FtsK [Lachnospiraceae bacterium]|nr:DNA translocase FtsK [Lachnospiraceae bacterium]